MEAPLTITGPSGTVSASVGVSGRAGMRRAAVESSTRTMPCCMRGSTHVADGEGEVHLAGLDRERRLVGAAIGHMGALEPAELQHRRGRHMRRRADAARAVAQPAGRAARAAASSAAMSRQGAALRTASSAGFSTTVVIGVKSRRTL